MGLPTVPKIWRCLRIKVKKCSLTLSCHCARLPRAFIHRVGLQGSVLPQLGAEGADDEPPASLQDTPGLGTAVQSAEYTEIRVHDTRGGCESDVK